MTYLKSNEKSDEIVTLSIKNTEYRLTLSEKEAKIQELEGTMATFESEN